MTPIVVSFVVHNRPHLLRKTLQAWSQVRGIEDVVLEFHCEPGCDEAVELCDEVSFAKAFVRVNGEQLGHARNVRKSMDSAFCITDYAIQAVDDFLPSTDLLELHAWHRRMFEGDDSVLGLTSGRDVPTPYGGLAGVWRCQLIGILSGFHKHKWELLARRWDEHWAYGNWWVWVNQCWLQNGHYDQLFPSLSRAEDLGDVHPATCFVPDPPPQMYYEVKGREHARGFQRWWEGGA